jgi:hypothetical protein
MTEMLSESGIVTPLLPPCVGEGVHDNNRDELWTPWAWRSHADVDPWWCYFGSGDVGGAMTDTTANDINGDFFVFAHRGQGINSFGLGLVARVGSLLIDPQIGWGGGDMNAKDATASVNASVAAWNQSLPSVPELPTRSGDPEAPDIRMRFSDYRRSCEVEIVFPGGRTEDPLVFGAPTGLGLVVDAALDYAELLNAPASAEQIAGHRQSGSAAVVATDAQISRL